MGLNRSVNKDNCTGEGYGGRAAGLRLKEEDLGLSVGRLLLLGGHSGVLVSKQCNTKEE